tara:strand:- start:1708 stop:5646 length:3939 start_codon:yes stop_codon:yes gene_type:complete
MNQRGDISMRWVFVFLGVVILATVLVGAVGEPSFKADTYADRTYYFLEDTEYTFNFSENVTGPEDMSLWRILNITSTNHSDSAHSDYPWFAWNDTAFSDSTEGVMKINATADNETGNFTKIDVYVLNGTSEVGISVPYNFQINATNDQPNFTVLDLEYNLTVDQEFYNYINATDEEDMFPLWFNITWFSNCSKADYNDRENCSLFQPTNLSDASAEMNFTPGNNDAGTYWANITIMDSGNSFSCPHNYCTAATYELNRTWERIVEFNVLSTLSINKTNCTGVVPKENVTFSCEINISTVGLVDTVNISTTSILTNSDDSNIANKTWFYGNESLQASSGSKAVNISFTAGKAEIGNWTINITVDDVNDSSAAVTELVYVNVTREFNNISMMSAVENLTASINLETTIHFNATDEDLLIPDKNVFAEAITFTRNVTFNASNSTGVDANYLLDVTTGVTSANQTLATFVFTPNSTDVGTYRVNITATDVDGVMNSTIFNITISDNIFPSWNQTIYDINLTVAAVQTDTSYYDANLTNGYVNDTETDSLTFTNTTNFTNFNLTSYGVLNITHWKQDVGSWEVNITATDELGLANTSTWRFNISNTNTDPNVTNLTNTATDTDVVDGGTLSWNEDTLLSFNLSIRDDDFLILDDQKKVYNETLDVNVTFLNFSNGAVVTYLFNFTAQGITGDHHDYLAEFTPDNRHVGSYNMTINVTDASNVSDYYSINLTINAANDAPVLSGIYNQTLTNVTPDNEFYLDVNASDEEDGAESAGLLNFTLENMTTDGDFLLINETSGVIDFTVNSTSLGIWEFNVSVNDTNGQMNSEIFNVTIYGTPYVDFPSDGSTYSLTENTTSTLNFTVNHSVGYNLTYDFYVDGIAYSNSTDYNYTNLSLVESVSSSWGNGTNYSWEFTPNFTDETYDLVKNLTFVVYPVNSNVPNRTEANTTVNLKLNITHNNSAPQVYTSFGTYSGTYGASSPININLTSNFRDIDYDDPYYNQTVNFTVTSDQGTGSAIRAESSDSANGLPWNGTVDSWYLQLYALEGADELITISANDSSLSDTSDPFQVTFTAPSTTTTPTPSDGGGGTSKVKHYSLKIITPQDVIITPEKNLIQVPFTVENNGQVNLKKINLSSFVQFNNQFSEDVKISLGDDYIDELKFGQSEDFTMVISANTQKSGRYKATIYANVTAPKFSDWGDFFIVLKKTNESEAEQLLLFTEKFISENPECIELMELLKEARVYLNEGDYSESYRLSHQAVEACEDSISANEQVKFGTETVRDSFYYISFATLVIFFVGFVFYIYKRVRFNKAKVDEYI